MIILMFTDAEVNLSRRPALGHPWNCFVAATNDRPYNKPLARGTEAVRIEDSAKLQGVQKKKSLQEVKTPFFFFHSLLPFCQPTATKEPHV